MKYRLAVLLFVFVGVYIVFNRSSFRQNMFVWDASNYYMYLPAAVIYKDIGQYGFYSAVNNAYGISPGADIFCIYDMPTGRKLNKYAIGTALFEMPFFFVAHAWCKFTGTHPADGYSVPYQMAGVAGCIFWVALGLWLLGAMLRRHFNDAVTTITLLCVAFGTILYNYTIFNPGMSHPFEFMLFSAVLYHTDLLYATGKRRHFYWLGVVLGLVLITRPTDIIVAIIPLAWHVHDRVSLSGRTRFLRANLKDIAWAALLFLAVAMIQMAYWKYATGHWIYYSYQGEGFNFLKPHLFKGLFGYQKGWFVYTPMAFIAILGLLCMRGAAARYIPSVLLTLLLLTYVIFSWKVWWYGGGFGARAMIDTLPLHAFLLAFVIQQVFFKWRSMVVKGAFAIVLAFFIALNLFQTYQYSRYTIHWVLMSKEYYWRVFGKVDPTPEDLKYLMPGEEYTKEVEEANR